MLIFLTTFLPILLLLGAFFVLFPIVFKPWWLAIVSCGIFCLLMALIQSSWVVAPGKPGNRRVDFGTGVLFRFPTYREFASPSFIGFPFSRFPPWEFWAFPEDTDLDGIMAASLGRSLTAVKLKFEICEARSMVTGEHKLPT